MKHSRLWLILFISLVMIACNMSGNVSPASPSENPEIAEAGPTLSDEKPDPGSTPESEPGESSPTPSTPTAPDSTANAPAPAPAAANPGSNPGGASSASSSQPLSISSVRSSPNGLVYYGSCSASDPTLLSVEATIDPLNQIKSVRLWYDIFDSTGAAASGSTSMSQLGIGDYAGDINIGGIAPGAMGTGDGSVSFWIEAQDKSGISSYSHTYSVNIQYCPGAILGEPPSAPPVIVSFISNGPVQAGNWVELSWQTLGAACGVRLDGNSVDPNGFYSYGTFAGDTGKTYTHTLTAYGAPCSSPVETTSSLSVSITSGSTTAKGSGTLYDEQSLDLGDGNGNDIVFDMQSSGGYLIGTWGTKLARWSGGGPSISGCRNLLSSSVMSVTINQGDSFCFQTGSGNYGYLTINSMLMDLDWLANSNVVISYTTEVMP
jgi:hypothetical protein